MPYPLLNSAVVEYCDGIQCSNVEEGSADLNQSHIVWTAIGKIIRMLQDLLNDVQASTLGEYCIQILHLLKIITMYTDLQILTFPVNPII